MVDTETSLGFGVIFLALLGLIYFILYHVLFWNRYTGHILVSELFMLSVWVFVVPIAIFIVIGIIFAILD